MERISELLTRSSFTLTLQDPYAAAHSLIHWAARWGRVIERENRLFTTGPRTSAEVKFYVERDMDKFTHLHIAFNLDGDIIARTLSVTIEATLECALPAPSGLATATFRDFYLTRLWPVHHRLAQQTAASIADSARGQLSAREQTSTFRQR